MKIGYLQFGNPIELCYETATVLGSDHRLGIIKSMVEQGHEVTILTPIKKAHEHMLRPPWPMSSHINYSFLGQVEYECVQDKNLDLDVLFIQYGPTNTMFGYNAPNEDYRALFGNRTPYMHRVMAVVENFHGPIIYWQNDDLPIPLGEVDYGLPLNEVSTHNLRNVMGRWHPFEGDRKWMLLTTAWDVKVFKDENSSRRYMYHEKPFVFKYVPTMFCPNVFPYRPPQEDTMFDLLYLGAQGDAHRNKRLSELMGYYGSQHRKAIIGKWDPDEVKKRFGGLDIEFHAPVPQHQVCEMLNTSLCSIQVLKKRFHSYGMMSMRAIEAIRSGTILLVDSMIPGYRDYVADEFGVMSRSQASQKVQNIKELEYEDRVELSMAQNERLRTWDSLNWSDTYKEVA